MAPVKSRSPAGRTASRAKRVAVLFERRYNQPITDRAAQAFTTIMALAQAINVAGGTHAGQIRNALHVLRVPAAKTIIPGQGITFDRDGQNIYARGILLQILSGRYKVMYPPNLATARAVWPMQKAPG